MERNSPVKRRLTAILAADAVGYSAKMAENEERAHRTLAGHRRIIDNLIADHDGRIVGTAGDSVLAEFGSSVEAVRCAVEIQDALATRNDSLPPAERLEFRIGINLGDVIVDGADILGDGVNVASRLEGIAEPGGILIASSVFDQISGKLNLGFEDIGERSLKNIGRPVRAYRVARADAPQRPRAGTPRLLWPGIVAAAAAAIALTVFFVTGGSEGPAVPTPAPPQTAPPPAAAMPVPQPGAETAPPPVRTAKPATPPAPEKSQPKTPPTTYTGGFAQARCEGRGGRGNILRGPVRVSGGEVIIELGGLGDPGHITLRGRPDADGVLVLEGYVTPLAGRARGAKLPARYEGRLVNGRGMLSGTQGGHRCSVGLQLR